MLKTTCRGGMSLTILMVRKLLKYFAVKIRKAKKKKINRRLALNKVIKKKGGKQNLKLKNRDVHFNSWIETKIIVIKNELVCATIYR